jgi:hypothetical protein
VRAGQHWQWSGMAWHGMALGVAAGEGFPEKCPPPQANRNRTRTRCRCSAGSREQGAGRAGQGVGMGTGTGMETAGANGCKASQDWDRICCNCTASEGMAVHGKNAINKQAPAAPVPAPRSGSEDTELMHKRHKDAVLWPDDIAGSGGGCFGSWAGCWVVEEVRSQSTYGVLHCKVGERKANANACKNSNQATVTGSRGRDEGARGRLGVVGEGAGTQGRPQDVQQHGRRRRKRRKRRRGNSISLHCLQVARHASPTAPHCKHNATLHFHHVPTPRLKPHASRLTPHTPHRRTPRLLHLPRFNAASNHTQDSPRGRTSSQRAPKCCCSCSCSCPAPRHSSKLHLPALSESADCSFGS